MPQAGFPELHEELARWTDAGLTAVFWLRDDDAVSVTPQLQVLSTIARRYEIDVGLAVIPGALTPELAAWLAEWRPRVLPMCHGWQHTNHGTAERPGEFGTGRSPEDARRELTSAAQVASARLRSAGAFPERLYFVPPFGQIAPAFERALASLGYDGISNQPGRAERRHARLHAKFDWLPRNPAGKPLHHPRLEAHIDPIDWQRGTAKPANAVVSQLLGELRLRRKGFKPSAAPIGILCHHLVHDDAIWSMLEIIVSALRGAPATTFPSITSLAERYAFPRSAV